MRFSRSLRLTSYVLRPQTSSLAWILLIKLCRFVTASVFESLSFLCEFPARCWFLVSTGSDSGVHTRRSVPVCESMSRTKTGDGDCSPLCFVAQGQNRLFLAGFDFARCLLWFQPVTRNHSCQGVSFLASALCLEVLGWFQLLLTK